MKFENVDVVLLKNTINNLITSINYNSSKDVIDKISNNDIWNTKSRDTLKKALKNLTEIKYPNLEKKLQKILVIADKIEEYQKLSSANLEKITLLNSINEGISELDGEKFSKEDIENINSEISENEINMEIIKNFITNNI